MNNTLTEQLKDLWEVFEELQSTNSLNEKEAVVWALPEYLKDDFNLVLEILDGRHKLGYKYYHQLSMNSKTFTTLSDLLDYLREPLYDGDLSEANVQLHMMMTSQYAEYIEPIVNRTLRLGIGKSLLAKNNYSPMLAKKYDGKIARDITGYYITEKLDGNRCIAYFDKATSKWQFRSRNGKPLHVDFDMSNMSTDVIYDGEILSREQVKLSKAIYEYVKYHTKVDTVGNNSAFRNTSGLINRHTTDKDLVYVIFDIVDETLSYSARRVLLITENINSSNVEILPRLAKVYGRSELRDKAGELLDIVTGFGGEGVMINVASARYIPKRTNMLLKYKKSYSMDMQVVYTFKGNGKYENLVGGIHCRAITNDKTIECDVGSGLNDIQRLLWLNPQKIVNKIVEIEYFDLSQSKSSEGTTTYSLRFPRLKQVREDKDTTNVD